MSNKSTKQLMQDLQSAIKDLKGLHTNRDKMLQDIKTKQTATAEAPHEQK